MTVASRISLVTAVYAFPAAAPDLATAQAMTDGHRGVCSDCHVGAGNNRYELSSTDSMLVFAVDSFGFSRIIGTFDAIGGGFVFDPEDVGATSILATVDVASLELSDSALNALVLSDRFLDAAHHPAITFQSEAVRQIDQSHYRVAGGLSIAGVTRMVSLDVELNKLAAHPLTGRQTAGLVITGAFPRSEFGLPLGLPNIGDVVEFTVYAQGSLLD